jgi:polyisoprenoid-binding protein YceI
MMLAEFRSRHRFPAARLLAICAATAVLIFAPVLHAQESALRFDPAQTKVEFSLDGNMHTVHGKFVLKSSSIRFDPSDGKISGTIVVDATSGDTGNNGRDKRMHHEILESDKFPEIIFALRQVAGKITLDAPCTVNVSGQIRLHGQDHDVTIPVSVKPDGSNLQIAAHIDVPYVQWGLKNPSNFLLRVASSVSVEIHAAGRLETAAASR